MSQDNVGDLKVSLDQVISFGEPNGISSKLRLLKELQLGNAKWTKHVNVMFTPNDNIYTMFPELAADETANFAMWIVDGGFINAIEVNRNDDWVSYYNVNGVSIRSSGASTGTERPKVWAIDGRAGATNPMPQGVEVSVCLFIAELENP